MDKLTKEEVMHVSKLARIEVNSEELEQYQINLWKIFNEIDTIKDIEVDTDILITPTSATATYRDSNEVLLRDSKDILKNAASSSGNYIEIPVVINE